MMVSKRLVWGMLALAAGAGMTAMLLPPARGRWRRSGRQDDEQSARVDEASEDSFPASDPPSTSAPSTAVPGPAS